MQSKVFFDQVKLKQPVPIRNDMMDHDQIKDVYYVYPQRQLLEEWTANDSFAATRYLEQFNPREKYEFGPPKTKQLIFKWAFGVTDECID